MASKSKKGIIGYIVFGLIIPVIIISVYLVGLYYYLYGFENYNSEVYLKEYLNLLASDDYEKIMKYNNIETDEFNSSLEFGMYMDEEYGEDRQKQVIIKDEKKSTKDKHYYNVQFGGKTIKEFVVNRTEEERLFVFNTWKVEPTEKDIYRKSVKVFVPEGVDIYVNDVKVSKDHLTDEEIVFEEFKAILDEGHVHPKLSCYEVTDLMAVSNVAVKREDGGACQLDVKDGVYYVTSEIPPEILEVVKPFAEDFAKKYSAFISEDYKFRDLKEFLYKNTTYYKTLSEFYNGWFPVHTGFGYENVEFLREKLYDNNHVSIQIKYNFYVTHGNDKKRDYPVAYDIFLANIEGKWYVVNVNNF